jgi:DNA-binding MarR family transcriptional regulator
MAAELAQGIEAVRRFTRFYTRQIGALEEVLLSSPFSLAEARVLYELAHRDQPTAAELCEELGLDAGYLSRILRGFARRGLVTKQPSQSDRRQILLALSADGRRAFGLLEQAARDQVGALLEPLSETGQDRLL